MTRQGTGDPDRHRNMRIEIERRTGDGKIKQGAHDRHRDTEQRKHGNQNLRSRNSPETQQE